MQVEWRWWWRKHRRRSIVVDDPAPHHHFHQLPCLASYLLLFFGLYISEASADDANWASNSSDGIARAGGRVAASASSSSSSSSSSHVIVATVATAAAAAAATAALLVAMRYHRRRISKGEIIGEYERFAEPFLKISPAGRVEEFERFPQYVARQLGLGSLNECPSLGKLASDYLVKAKGCEDQIYSFFSGSGVNPDDAESASQKLIDELDKCILGYLAFHWDHAPTVINQVLSEDGKPKKKLRHMVMEATRAIRFERITKDLKVTRMFSTLWEEMKVIGSVHGGSGSGAKDRCTEVMVPAARGERSPVLMLMGGGMGAGKSTVLKDILTEPFWTATEPVVVEADQFKETDVIYRALSSRGHHNDMLQTAELVHQSSTDAASSLLVTALNEGRDVIMDGTLSWEPFVRQTIEMARAVHKHRYRMGPGYKKGVDGEPDTEEYWQQVDGEEGQVDCENGFQERKPYRIELVGVVCDAYMAVVRGIRRAIMVKRAVRVKSQLRSHKMFAYNFSRYCEIVDCARLYSTNSIGAPPKLIAWKLVSSRLLVDSAEIHCLQKLASLNENADSIHQLYPPDDDEDDASKQLPRLHSIWDDIVVSPNRVALQAELKAALLKVESNANISMVS